MGDQVKAPLSATEYDSSVMVYGRPHLVPHDPERGAILSDSCASDRCCFFQSGRWFIYLNNIFSTHKNFVTKMKTYKVVIVILVNWHVSLREFFTKIVAAILYKMSASKMWQFTWIAVTDLKRDAFSGGDFFFVTTWFRFPPREWIRFFMSRSTCCKHATPMTEPRSLFHIRWTEYCEHDHWSAHVGFNRKIEKVYFLNVCRMQYKKRLCFLAEHFTDFRTEYCYKFSKIYWTNSIRILNQNVASKSRRLKCHCMQH